jgi:hypothetical protein
VQTFSTEGRQEDGSENTGAGEGKGEVENKGKHRIGWDGPATAFKEYDDSAIYGGADEHNGRGMAL